MTWDDYGISKYRYQELKAFCLQYEEKKNKIKYGPSSMNHDGTTGSGGIGRPTEQQAINNEKYLKDIRMIEEAAVRANPGIWKYILKSVTQGLPYEFIEYDDQFGKIPMCKNDFYGTRRKFYAILNELKMEYKSSAKQ